MRQLNVKRLVAYFQQNILTSSFLIVMHIRYFPPLVYPLIYDPVLQINLVVRDYFKSNAGVLQFTDAASELIVWLHSKTLILALIRGVQQALPGTEDVKAIIRAVLTWWTMHYQAFRRLGELHDVIVMVVQDDEKKPVKDRYLVTGNT